ncbi:MAG: hypothetical protein ACOCRO_08430, partial [Halanaerobiales bacterium]
GYLMLVKSFTDDLAWRVQRELINSYFKSKEMAKYVDPVLKIIDEEAIDSMDRKNLLEIHYLNQLMLNIPKSKSYPGMLRMAEIQYNNYRRILNVKEYNIEKIKEITTTIKKEPKITQSKPTLTALPGGSSNSRDRSNVVAPNKIAVDLGIFSTKNNPHSNLISAIAKELGYNINKVNAGYEDKYICCDYGISDKGLQVLYKPIAVKEIKEWWYTNSLDRYKEKEYKNTSEYGNVGDIQTIYYIINGKKYRVYYAPDAEEYGVKLKDVMRDKNQERIVS